MPTPTGNENLNQALAIAQSICWDETHGYTMGADMNPDTDCSGFVGYALSHAGFNVPQRWDTTTMIPTLQAYPGFNHYIWYPGMQLQHGDIFVYDEGGGANGHTFFYAENVNGYTDDTARTAATGMLSRARIEAASSRESGYQYPNDPNTIPGDVNNPDLPGDSPRNGVGACWEVWIHPYSAPSTSHTWHLFRWQGGAAPQLSPIQIAMMHKRNQPFIRKVYL